MQIDFSKDEIMYIYSKILYDGSKFNTWKRCVDKIRDVFDFEELDWK